MNTPVMEMASHIGPRHEVYMPFSVVLIPMDDWGYCDYINDTSYVMDDFGNAIQTPWVDWPETY
jgi:hypothetical protein